MNGQMYQICCIVAAAKKALMDNEPMKYVQMNYEKKIEFCFLPKKQFLNQKTYTAENVALWFEHCKKNRLEDVKLLVPTSVMNREHLGFSNTTESSIVCFYNGGIVTYFTSDWRYDSSQKEWNILYTEHEWPNVPSGKPYFENNSVSFQKALKDIKDLAMQIECDNFANIFSNALSILNGSGDFPDKVHGLARPSLPTTHMPIFEAASTADVFGAMGSWNDEPPYMAHEKGLDAEYKMLSDELLKNIRFAILYSVNEW